VTLAFTATPLEEAPKETGKRKKDVDAPSEEDDKKKEQRQQPADVSEEQSETTGEGDPSE
jgi:hypothetical protein